MSKNDRIQEEIRLTAEEGWTKLSQAMQACNYTAAYGLARSLRKLTSATWDERWREFDDNIIEAFCCELPDYQEMDRLRQVVENLTQENRRLSRENLLLSDESNEASQVAQDFENRLKEVEQAKAVLAKRLEKLNADLAKGKKPQQGESDRLRIARKLNGHLIALVRKLQDELGKPKKKRAITPEIMNDPEEFGYDRALKRGDDYPESYLDDEYPPLDI